MNMINLLDYKVFVDGTIEPLTVFTEKDLNFFKDFHDNKGKRLPPLIDLRGDNAMIKFVGQVITPSCRYISLPKSFTINEKNIDLIIRVINRYQDEKDKNRQDLLTNYSFVSDKEGEIESNAFFFNKLKKFFLDYITYEFIYPKEKLIVHSNQPLKGEIDPLKTDLNQEIYGGGITYKIKDIKNNDKWNLDDIYYSTLNLLSKNYGSSNDKKRIENMKNFLFNEGYEMKIDPRIKEEMADEEINSIINDIKKIGVDPLHEVIKNTLISYYNSEKIKEKNTIRAFYTQNFWSIWEHFSQIALYHNHDFKKELEYEGVKQYHSQLEIIKKGKDSVMIKPGDIIKKADRRPDIFSENNGMRFIGDCKYYSNKDSDFDKEMFIYNNLCNNEYPVCIFIPDMETKLLRTEEERLKNDFLEMLVFSISLEEVISDVMNEKNIVIDKVQKIIKEKSERYQESLEDISDEENDEDIISIVGIPSGEYIEMERSDFSKVKDLIKWDDDNRYYSFNDKDYKKIKSLISSETF